MADVTVLIPAHNEAGRIGKVVDELVPTYSVMVVDDGSSDATTVEAQDNGATVLTEDENRGYISALKRGFGQVASDIVVTYDADGEHRPDHILRLIEPIAEDEKDLVLGARKTIPRPSERVLNRMAQSKVAVSDTGTGLRAVRSSLAKQLELETACTCGTLVLEAVAKGARVGEVEIETRSIQKPRGIAWKHGRQFFHVLRHLRTV